MIKNTLVIGLTSLPSGGKDYTADILSRKYGFYKVSPGEILRSKMKAAGIKSFDRKAQEKLQNQLRKKYGKYYIMELCYRRILRSKRRRIVIPGIRFPFDITFYKKRFDGNFINIAIDAPARLRYEREVKRNREDAPKTYAQFIRNDAAERKTFNLEKTMKLSDFRVRNHINDSKYFERDIEKVISHFLLKNASSMSK